MCSDSGPSLKKPGATLCGPTAVPELPAGAGENGKFMVSGGKAEIDLKGLKAPVSLDCTVRTEFGKAYTFSHSIDASLQPRRRRRRALGFQMGGFSRPAEDSPDSHHRRPAGFDSRSALHRRLDLPACAARAGSGFRHDRSFVSRNRLRRPARTMTPPGERACEPGAADAGLARAAAMPMDAGDPITKGPVRLTSGASRTTIS